MLSRLSLRSGSFGQLLARPEVRNQVVLSLARCSSSETPLSKHLENWDKANQVYYGPERDLKNFPALKMPETTPPTRMGIFPESWFTAIGEKTGVTGPYVLGAGFVTFLLSKEIWIVEHGFTEFIAFWGAVIYLSKKFGPSMGAYLDNMTEQYNQKHWIQPLADAKAGAQSFIKETENRVWQEEGQKQIFDVKRENVDLQLEAIYRQRLADVHTQVKKRVDYQMATENSKRRFEQEHMVDWIVGSVLKGITPAQEKESLNQCMKDLKALSARTAIA